jgi:hypothetical protein
MKRFAARLRREHAQEIESDAKEFKHRACGLLKRYLPPFAGRPTEDSINTAAKLRKQNREWQEIYPVAIPEHATLDPPVRRQAESNLRSALRSRRNARKRRRRRRRLGVETKPRALRPQRKKQAVLRER